MTLVGKYINQIIAIIFFSFIYFITAKADLFDLFFIFTLVTGSIFIAKRFLNKKDKGKLLFLFSFLLLTPLGLSDDIKLIILPPGYQYICVSLIASILFLSLKRTEIKDISTLNLILSFIKATLAPYTYISGPSATIKEIQEPDVIKNGLPTIQSIKNFKLALSISGFFRITLGYVLSTRNFDLLEYASRTQNIVALFLIVFVFGFYNFWKYYLLFSGASELCKSFLSLIGINLIDNFKDPEKSIFYHDIWGKWHLNITERIRNYLFTPITLFSLRRFSLLNPTIQFFLIEGMPAITLFILLAIWHGARPIDFLFAIFSTILTISSRALSKVKFLKYILSKNKIFREFFSLINISLFGVGLSIYDLDLNRSKDVLNTGTETSNFLIYYIFVFLIYLYFRFKIFMKDKITSTNGNEFIKNKIILIIIEFLLACYFQIYWIPGSSIQSNFIYFAG